MYTYTNNFNKCNRLTKNIDFTWEKKSDFVIVWVRIAIWYNAIRIQATCIRHAKLVNVTVHITGINIRSLSLFRLFSFNIIDRFADWCCKMKNDTHTNRTNEKYRIVQKKSCCYSYKCMSFYRKIVNRGKIIRFKRKILFRVQD